MTRLAAAVVGIWAAGLGAACAAGSPCRSGEFHRFTGYSRPYFGAWAVAHGDTLTMPEMGDRFHLDRFVLDSDTVRVDRACRFRGRLVFSVPAETLAVTWFAQPEHGLIFGWPATLGPFGGLSVAWWGRDSLRGALLFDQSLGIQVKPGTTAQFTAGRAR